MPCCQLRIWYQNYQELNSSNCVAFWHYTFSGNFPNLRSHGTIDGFDPITTCGICLRAAVFELDEICSFYPLNSVSRLPEPILIPKLTATAAANPIHNSVGPQLS